MRIKFFFKLNLNLFSQPENLSFFVKIFLSILNSNLKVAQFDFY